MLKKQTAILFIFIAQLVLWGHNLVPHHHHEEVPGQTAHSKDHHHEDDSEGVLEFAFANFVHTADGGHYITNAPSEIAYAKQIIKSACIPEQWDFTYNLSVAILKHQFPPGHEFIHSDSYLRIHSLRGPPSFIVS